MFGEFGRKRQRGGVEGLIRELKAVSAGNESCGSRLDSCCLLFGEFPTSAVPTVVEGEAQPGVFEVLLCYYMDWFVLCAAIIQSTHHI